jgi:hypothetical protein
VYRWTGSGIARAADATVTAGGIDASFPARSMTLFVVDTPAPAPSLLPTLPAVPALPTSTTVAGAPATARRSACVVPKLAGRTLSQARRALRRAGCATGRIRHPSRRKGRRHRIVSQSPRPGRKLREGAAVSVVVSR